jgi:hypothetical protein
MPSLSGKTEKVLLSNRRRSKTASSSRLPRLKERTVRSSWAVDESLATAISRFSLAGVATRVTARTFENESSPRLIEALVSGKPTRARAVRTFSLAVPRSIPVLKESQ